jgi:hypothetical protein
MTNKAVVAVCDILGYGNLVKDTPLEEVINYHIENFRIVLASSIPRFESLSVAPTSDQVFRERLVGHVAFSDTVLIYSLADDLNGYKNVVDVVWGLLSRPILYPQLRFRIGVSYGDFYHNSEKNIYVGKALIEAYELEKRQEWCGGALTKPAEEKMGSYALLTLYDVPVKLNKTESLLAINWTLAKHDVIDKADGWMPRDYGYAIPSTEEEIEIERKLRNTERFHFEKCVQCKAHRNNFL